jgi:hypothetical protein
VNNTRGWKECRRNGSDFLLWHRMNKTACNLHLYTKLSIIQKETELARIKNYILASCCSITYDKNYAFSVNIQQLWQKKHVSIIQLLYVDGKSIVFIISRIRHFIFISKNVSTQGTQIENTLNNNRIGKACEACEKVGWAHSFVLNYYCFRAC